MNTVERIIALIAVALMGVFFYAVWSAREAGIRLPAPCAVTADNFGEPRITTNAEGRVQIFATAKMFSCLPAQIEVPVGTEVDLFLISKDVVHGFQISKRNINLMAVYGAPNFVQGIRFDKPGDYEIICNEYCGAAHQAMFGHITAR